MSALGIISPRSPSRPASSSYPAFNLPSDSSDDSSTDEPLPFPTALVRNDFLVPDFQPAGYLSSLFPSDADTTSAHRHQTLEDLRSELRERSTAISAELLELVNSNYTSFLELGSELKGGEERVEDVRVALMGFQRAIEDVKGRVTERRAEVAEVCRELGDTRREIEMGRRMLELDERVGMLERRLTVGSLPRVEKEEPSEDTFDIDETEGEDDQEDEEEEAERYVGSSPGKLMALARESVVVEHLADSVGRDMPFVTRIEERMTRCRNTILLDLNAATKEARRAGQAGQGRMLKFLSIYRVLGGQVEAVRVLREK